MKSVSRLLKYERFQRSNIHIEARIDALGYKLSKRVYPRGNYVPYVVTNNHVYLAGHLPINHEEKMMVGRLGENLDVEKGKVAAKLAGLQMISTLKLALGDLDRIKRIVKINGVVNSTLDFTQQADVMNGCSDLFGEIFGTEVGSHARTSIGTSVLPLGIPIEVEGIIEFE